MKLLPTDFVISNVAVTNDDLRTPQLMKYGVLFILMAVVAAWAATTASQLPIRVGLLLTVVSFLVVGVAYSGNWPGLLFKRADGTRAWWAWSSCGPITAWLGSRSGSTASQLARPPQMRFHPASGSADACPRGSRGMMASSGPPSWIWPLNLVGRLCPQPHICRCRFLMARHLRLSKCDAELIGSTNTEVLDPCWFIARWVTGGARPWSLHG